VLKLVRNKKLYDYIVNNYINDRKVSVKDICKKFNMSEGAIKNFMYRYNLNRKNFYKAFKSKIRDFYYQGKPVNQIAKENGITESYVYEIMSERGIK